MPADSPRPQDERFIPPADDAGPDEQAPDAGGETLAEKIRRFRRPVPVRRRDAPAPGDPYRRHSRDR